MSIELLDDGTVVIEENGVRVVMSNGGYDRRCGACTLCCKLLPVKEFRKPANTVCKYQRSGKGCTVHGTSEQPTTCKIWACRWLMNEDTEDLARPDRSHYVIDITPDVVVLENNATKERTRILVVQIWVHPSYPNAHRDPKLRAWLERRAANTGEAAIVRFDSRRALHLFPPALNVDGVWHEREGGELVERAHTPAEIFGR